MSVREACDWRNSHEQEFIAACTETLDRVVPVRESADGRAAHFRYLHTEPESERHRRIKRAIVKAADADPHLAAQPEWSSHDADGRLWRADVRVSHEYRHCIVEVQLSPRPAADHWRRHCERLGNLSIAEVIWLVPKDFPWDFFEQSRTHRWRHPCLPEAHRLEEADDRDYVVTEEGSKEVGAYVCSRARLRPAS